MMKPVGYAFLGVNLGDSGDYPAEYIEDREALATMLNGSAAQLVAGKLAMMLLIANSEGSDFRKSFEMQKQFANAEEFNKLFQTLKQRTFDDLAIQYYEKLDDIYKQFREYDEKGISKIAEQETKKEEMAYNLATAKVFAEEYITDQDSYDTEAFLNKKGITESKYNEMLSLLREKDSSAYAKYLEVAAQNAKVRLGLASENMENVYTGITTGETKDGTPFDLLEFCRYFPYLTEFSSSEGLRDLGVSAASAYSVRIKRLIREMHKDGANDIIKYFASNRISDISVKEIDEADLRKTRETVFDREITDEDKTNILNYIDESGMPRVRIVYTAVRNKMLALEKKGETLPTPKAKRKEV